MQDHQQASTDSKAGAGQRWIARLLVLAGAAMLAWSAAFVIEARVSQDAARRSLELASRSRAVASPHDVVGTINLATSNRSATRGSPLAELRIPRVHLSSIVLHGSDTQTLRRGPGHLEHTPLPGESGNVGIAGHRDTFFRQLRDVKIGDDVFLNTPQGRFHYLITWARVVGAQDVSVLEPTTDDALTLVTCYPFWVLGPAPDRFVVRATRVGQSPAMVVESDTRPTAVAVPAAVAPVQAGIADDRAGTVPAMALDDEALIRAAIGRFRVAYNGWLINHHERGAGLLRLSTCDVAITGNVAEATCDASFGQPAARSGRVRTLTLECAEGAWVIRSTANEVEETVAATGGES